MTASDQAILRKIIRQELRNFLIEGNLIQKNKDDRGKGEIQPKKKQDPSIIKPSQPKPGSGKKLLNDGK